MKFKSLDRKFTEEGYSSNIDELNTGLSKLTLPDNLSGSITIVGDIGAGKSLKVPHSMGAVSLFWLNLGQRGASLITSGDEDFTENYITLKNTGTNDVAALKIFIGRA